MAVQKNQDCENVVIVGEDVDLLVLLTHFGSGVENDIYFFKPKMGRVKDKYFTQRSFMYPALTKNILFLHLVSGCDTTNALFDKGKKKLQIF